MSGARQVRCKLVFYPDPQAAAREIVVDKPRFVIGRGYDADAIIPAPSVSREHARLEQVNGGWRIVDLESQNGVKVNGETVDRAVLADKDVISVGSVNLTFRLIESLSNTRIVVDETAGSGARAMTEFRMQDFDVIPADPEAAALATVAATTWRGGGRARGSGWLIELVERATAEVFASEDLDGMLDRFLDLAMETLPARRGAICLYDPEHDSIVPKAARHVRGDDEEVVISRTIADEVLKGEKSLLFADVSKVDRFAEVASVVASRPRSVICAPLFREGKTSGLLYLDTQGGVGAFSDADLRVLTTLGLLAAVGIQQASLRDLIAQERRKRTRLERYHSPHVVDRILRQGSTLGDEMVAEEREVTVLFADLHRFTNLSEDLHPAKVAAVLNAVFERLTEVVFRFEATLDKFTGDGLMAIFGAPLSQPDHADRAVTAALAMRDEIRQLNDKLDLPQPLVMRFGINTGSVVAGDIGASSRRDYTVIGDPVNVASRLESMVARPGQIVIGSRTRELLTGDIECSPLGSVTVKGRDEPIHPYLVVEAAQNLTTAETEAISDGK